jgi:Glycosyl hydrolase family 3 C terminal domain.
VVSAYVSPTPFVGSISADASFSAMIDSLANGHKPVIVISFGTPYLLSAFPSVTTYMLAWGGAPVSQHAAARALLGEAAITGRLPISIPPRLKFGDGIDRPIRTAGPR